MKARKQKPKAKAKTKIPKYQTPNIHADAAICSFKLDFKALLPQNTKIQITAYTEHDDFKINCSNLYIKPHLNTYT